MKSAMLAPQNASRKGAHKSKLSRSSNLEEMMVLWAGGLFNTCPVYSFVFSPPCFGIKVNALAVQVQGSEAAISRCHDGLFDSDPWQFPWTLKSNLSPGLR